MIIVGVSKRSLIPLWLVLGGLCFLLSQAADTLRPGENLRDNETLVTSGGLFELGFFISGGASSSNHYLGIWFKNDPNKKAVWVANREHPILDSSGVLTIGYDGNLVITDRRQIPIIVNSGMLSTSSNTSVELLDSGNLVLRAGERIVWESFYYPSDTFLPGMKLGLFGLKTGRLHSQSLTSWLSPQVPAPGAFTLAVDPNNTKQLVIWRRGVLYWRSGTWNGHNFSYLSDFELIDQLFRFNFSYFSNKNESYFTFAVNSLSRWIEIDSFGKINQFAYAAEYGMVLSSQSPCDDDNVETRSKGCVTPEPSRCRGGDVFHQVQGVMSDEWTNLHNFSLGLSDCKEICMRNCSCNAYASIESNGTGCVFSQGPKPDSVDSEGEIFYSRNNTDVVPHPQPPPPNTVVEKDRGRKKKLWFIVISLVVSLVVLIVVSLMCYSRWRNHNRKGWNGNQDTTRRSLELFLFQFGTDIATIDEVSSENRVEFGRKKDHELPLLSFSCLATATDNFSAANKLGEGGFGPVYKGILLGHEIAVKRLSRRSGQGQEEFKNEVHLISNLQHRNLVRLLGCCIQGEEKMLIYEYLPNKSLDSFLFDASKRALLDWGKRIHIIEGIAQGLLYLHKYSRLRIIHRDLKTSNILLDGHMNPKISDFGMARIFREDEVRAKTTRVVGTYGYMSPEYAVHGLFSIKSDVFSFGVIMLEIISGERNTTRSLNLLGYAWELWKDGQGMELMDPTLTDSCSMSELMLCIQVGLLCVQESPEDRPTMSDVVTMLSNESTNLPAPKQPAFSTHSPSRRQHPCSVNDVTVSDIEAR